MSVLQSFIRTSSSIIFVFTCSMLLCVMPASSMEGDTYAAIAISSNGQHFGTSNKQESKRKAFSEAKKQCRKKGKRCKIATWSTRCVALALGSGNAWGAAWADKKRGASRSAINKCKKFGGGCRVKVAMCN